MFADVAFIVFAVIAIGIVLYFQSQRFDDLRKPHDVGLDAFGKRIRFRFNPRGGKLAGSTGPRDWILSLIVLMIIVAVILLRH